MSQSTEGTLAIVAALFVVFSAMLNPLVSAGAAAVMLAGYGILKFAHKI